MPDVDAEDQSRALIEMIRNHADQIVIPPKPASGEVGTRLNRGVQAAVRGIGQSVMEEAHRQKGPLDLLETESNVLGVGEGAAAANMLRQIPQKVMKFAKEYPQAAMGILSSLGLTTGASAAGSKKAVPEVPGVVASTDDFESAKTELKKAIDDLQKEIDSAKSSTKIITPTGRQIERGGTDPTITKQKTDRLNLLQQQYDKMLGQEKPFLETYPRFPEYASGIGGALGTMFGLRAIESARKSGIPLNWAQKAGLPGMLYGLPEWAGAFGIPQGSDLRGVGRAKRAAENESWESIAKRALFELGEASGASGVGYKIGTAALPGPVKGGINVSQLAQVLKRLEKLEQSGSEIPTDLLSRLERLESSATKSIPRPGEHLPLPAPQEATSMTTPALPSLTVPRPKIIKHANAYQYETGGFPTNAAIEEQFGKQAIEEKRVNRAFERMQTIDDLLQDIGKE